MANKIENRSFGESEDGEGLSPAQEAAPLEPTFESDKRALENQQEQIVTQTAERGHDRFGTGKAIRAGVLLLAITTGCRSGVQEKGHPRRPSPKTEIRQSVDENETESEERQPTEKDILSAFRQFGFSAQSRGDGTFEVRIADNFGNSDCYRVGPEELAELKGLQQEFDRRSEIATMFANQFMNNAQKIERIKRDFIEPRMIGVVRRCEKLGFDQLSPKMQKLMQGDQQRKEAVKKQIRKQRGIKEPALEQVEPAAKPSDSKKEQKFEVKSAQGRKILEHERDINRLRMINLELANEQEKLHDWEAKINSEGGRNTKDRAELEVFLTKIREYYEKIDERDALADKINGAKRHKQVWGEF